jgi:hypothetical protein
MVGKTGKKEEGQAGTLLSTERRWGSELISHYKECSRLFFFKGAARRYIFVFWLGRNLERCIDDRPFLFCA